MRATLKTLPMIVISMLIIAYGAIGVNQIAYAKLQDATFVGTQKTIIVQKFSTPTGSTDESFVKQGLKPYLYDRSDQFDAVYDVTVKWDGNAVAAAYVPAILEVYKSTNPNYSGVIISKRPTLVGLIAVFRGSSHSGTIGNVHWTDDFKLLNGKIYLHVAVKETTYTYSVKIFSTTLDTREIMVSAWAKASVGISAGLKLFDFVDASLDLAKVEAGVEAKIVDIQETENGYEVTVQFSVPTYQIKVNYQAYVKVEEVYNAYGNGPLPNSRGTIGLTNSITEVYYYDLNSVGSYVAYSDYMDIGPYTGYHEFNGGGTTGTIVFG